MLLKVSDNSLYSTHKLKLGATPVVRNRFILGYEPSSDSMPAASYLVDPVGLEPTPPS